MSARTTAGGTAQATDNLLLISGFLESAERFPDRPAVEVAKTAISYRALRDRGAALAATLDRVAGREGPSLTGVFASRSPTAFAGVVASLMRGHGYVPFNRTFPIERTRGMLEKAGVRALIVDGESEHQLEDVLEGHPEPLTLVLPDRDDVSALAERLPGHTVLGARDLAAASDYAPPESGEDSFAYVLFTSGSTGQPKGVLVGQHAVRRHAQVIAERIEATEEDRFTNVNELTFDMSVTDIFCAWEVGACCCCPTRKTLIRPDGFVRDSRCTIWYSVASTAIFMKQLGGLKPGSLPSLRWSLWAGERLTLEVAQSWQEAAPNSVIDNMYGPTETTDNCFGYRWDPETSPALCEQRTVPIGWPAPGTTYMIVDEDLEEVGPGEEGELLIAGDQVALGYWRDPERTAAAFFVPPGRDEIHYRTGDRVRRPRSDDLPITFIGRLDGQIQVFGERIELGEVEAVVREVTGIDAVVAVGWPVVASGNANGIEVFVGSPGADGEALRAQLHEHLPGQMAPRRVHVRDELPRNDNGKHDRGALMRWLEENG